MECEDLISSLNDLIETSRDGEEGFLACAEQLRDPAIKSFFSERAAQCARTVSELQNQVLALGGKPGRRGSVSSALHRRWRDIKSVITDQDDEAVLDECERGEDAAVDRYRRALETPLSDSLRTMVEQQYQEVLRNRDAVKALRERVRTANRTR